ncbi:MAG: YciI family protein [Solirubrobacteraceae bacterium]
MKSEPGRIRAVAAEHAAYWQGLELRRYLGGPFADRSGGLIIFEIDSPDEAEQLVAHDPFLREGLLERRWLKEWNVE